MDKELPGNVVIFDVDGLDQRTEFQTCVLDRPTEGTITTSNLLESAYGTVEFKNASLEFLEAIYCGIPAGSPPVIGGDKARLAVAASHNDLYVHTGGFPGSTKPGFYVNVNPYAAGFALEHVTNFDTGAALSQKGIGLYVVAFAEIDEGADGQPIALKDQCRIIDTLMAEGLPVPNAVVMSGDDRGSPFTGGQNGDPGKSLHVFFALHPTDLETFHAIQRHLIALLRSDVQIRDPGRRMRFVSRFGQSVPPLVRPNGSA